MSNNTPPKQVRLKPGVTEGQVEARYQAAVNGGPKEQKAYDDCFEGDTP